MELSRFQYHLPPDLIAQEPVEPRDASRLLALDRAKRAWSDRRFADLPALLRPGDCLVANETKVVPARLFGTVGGHSVELVMLRAVSATRWEALVRPGRRCRPGATVELGSGAARARIAGVAAGGARIVDIDAPWPVSELMERYGLPPLPPYIDRHVSPKPEDRERYQTVYARAEGSVAAPTAGLHFTPELLGRLDDLGVERHFLTLHVGPGTFRPIKAADVALHSMDAEEVHVPDETARAVNRAKAEGRRVIAIGTTTTRALEWAAREDGRVRPGAGAADLFIRPDYAFAVVDGLVTNFHLPRSTLLLLVAALCGIDLVLDAYRHAVAARYRFYSYGDAMLIV